jgi:hypothetical protein
MADCSLKEKDIEASVRDDSRDTAVGEVKDVRNADAALAFLQYEGEVREMTPEDEKALRRKIDWYIMPLMVCKPSHARMSNKLDE